MAHSVWIFAAPVFLLVLSIRFALYLLRSPLRTVPGPFLARFTDGWYFWTVRKGFFHIANLELHNKYGAVVRYGPNRYSINDPEAMKTIYGLGNHFPKSRWYSAWGTPAGQWTLFSDQSVQRHSQNRRLYQAVYSMSSLVHYESFVDDCAAIFSQRLSEMATKSDLTVDMRYWFQCYAFDVIAMITYAKRIGFLDHGDDVGGIIRAIDGMLSYATLVGIFPSLHGILLYLSGKKASGRAFLVRYTKERMRESRSRPKPIAIDESADVAGDFLTKFTAKHAANPDSFTSYHVLAGCTSNMAAGSDTTAISLSATLYYLLKNPACLQKLRGEIDNQIAQGRLSESPTFVESQQMPYLQAVLKEALRMHPASGLPLERVVPEGGATMCGRFFPEGTIVGVNTWVVQRDPHVFGDDAEKFNPDRWLIDDAERLSAMNQCYIPFGLGSRTCIGRHVSMLEMSKLIPRIIRDFDFSLDAGLQDKEWRVLNYWFVKPLDFQVRVKRRNR